MKRYSWLLITLLTGVLLVGMATDSKAKLIRGYADTLFSGFDFSEGRESWPADLWIFEDWVDPEWPPSSIIFAAAGGIIDMGAIPLEAIMIAPDTSEVNYHAPHEIIAGHSYVLRTREGYFAKIFVRVFDPAGPGVIFDWVYQDDGSRNLGTTTVIEAGTWGKIKAFFKRLF